MKVLFISRTYPPLVGGMEKFASDFYHNYRKVGDIDLLANAGGKKMLPFFLFRVTVSLLIHSRKYDVIHLYDAVLSPFISLIKLVSMAKVSLTVNGLDIVYANFGYQKIMPFFLKKADKVIAISQHTMEQCRLRGIPKDKLVVIPVGFDFRAVNMLRKEKRIETLSKFGVPFDEKKILITVGRLVKRKGHAWFIEHVLRNLPKEYIYLIVGDGPEKNPLSNLVSKIGFTERVYFLGSVSDEEKDALYQVVDLFVMPNIQVKNDQEGFGIVLLEAGQYGLPVIASNIEGIKDVVIDRASGILVAEKDSKGFINSILEFRSDHTVVLKNAIKSKFSWSKVMDTYVEVFENVCGYGKQLGDNS